MAKSTKFVTSKTAEQIKQIVAACNNLREEATSGFCYEAFYVLLGKRQALALTESATARSHSETSARSLAIEFGLDEHLGLDKAIDLIKRYQEP